MNWSTLLCCIDLKKQPLMYMVDPEARSYSPDINGRGGQQQIKKIWDDTLFIIFNDTSWDIITKLLKFATEILGHDQSEKRTKRVRSDKIEKLSQKRKNPRILIDNTSFNQQCIIERFKQGRNKDHFEGNKERTKKTSCGRNRQQIKRYRECQA